MDHYQTLQVIRDADTEVIERAYKALSMKHHPDRAAPEHLGESTRRMQQINEAYRVLKDPVARRRYDATLPPVGESGWDQFWDRGLVGLFADRFMPRAR